MIEVRQIALFTKWFEKQTPEVKREVADNVNRLKQGNSSNLKLVRGAIIELKIHYGKGIRIYPPTNTITEVSQNGEILHKLRHIGKDL